MSWFVKYCEEAAQTDRLTDNPNHLTILAAGLFGETGSMLAELKKTVRDRKGYPSYQNRLMEEIGDFLWYFARLVTVLAPSDKPTLKGSPAKPAEPGRSTPKEPLECEKSRPSSCAISTPTGSSPYSRQAVNG